MLHYSHVDARGYRDFVKQVPTDNTLDMSVWRKVWIISDGSKAPTEAILQNL
jgi:translation elongation factor EF-Tu-like GTPase